MANVTENYTHERIKYLLREKGGSMSSLARELKVSPASISNTVKGRSVSQKIQNAIATKLGVEASKIWPDRYLCSHCKSKIKSRLKTRRVEGV